MRMFFFDVTVKVENEGRPMEAVVYRGVRSESELDARRSVLGHYLDKGFQVLRLERVRERTFGPGSD